MKLLNLINKKVHIIGVNGIGMSALAVYLKKNKIDKENNKKTVCLNKRVMEYSVPIRE